MTADILVVPRLADQPALMESVLQALRAERAAGTIPANRPDPTGEEGVLVCGPLHAPLGFATFLAVGEGRVWLDLLIVAQPHRRQGLGRRLFESVLRAARHFGHGTVEFGTLAENVAMQRLAGGLALAPEGLLYSVHSARDPEQAPSLPAMRRAERVLSRLTAEQQSQCAALRQRIRRAQKQGEAVDA